MALDSTPMVVVSAARRHTCAVKNDGASLCFGKPGHWRLVLRQTAGGYYGKGRSHDRGRDRLQSAICIRGSRQEADATNGSEGRKGRRRVDSFFRCCLREPSADIVSESLPMREGDFR